jgi:uncharacterized protein (DUF1501 family)
MLLTRRPPSPLMLSRRQLLRGLGATACSIASAPLMTTVTLAGSNGGAPLGDNRLIVVILRGAMDGLDVIRPIGDPDYAGLRPTLLAKRGAPLGNFYELHPALAGMMPLWDRGQLAFVQATSTPYRDKRSHFDGQDMLEAGTGMDVPIASVRDGWMNRMLQAVPGLSSKTAFAFGADAMPLLQGDAPFLTWAPEQRLPISAQGEALLEAIYHDDPLFADASDEAIMLSRQFDPEAEDGMMALPAVKPGQAVKDAQVLAQYAGRQLKGDTRIAAFSLSGWDTHRSQVSAIQVPLGRLSALILALQEDLGPEVWDKTLLLAMTEFGRTARENGSAGTDHGTAGVMVMAGGAVKGGQVYGKWPGLAEADLYAARDLMPTSDVRSWAAWAMKGMYGFDSALLETTIFPGLDMGRDPKFLA